MAQIQLWDQGQWGCCHSRNLVTNRASLTCPPPGACLGITSVQERRLGISAAVGAGVRRYGPEESIHTSED